MKFSDFISLYKNNNTHINNPFNLIIHNTSNFIYNPSNSTPYTKFVNEFLTNNSWGELIDVPNAPLPPLPPILPKYKRNISSVPLGRNISNVSSRRSFNSKLNKRPICNAPLGIKN